MRSGQRGAQRLVSRKCRRTLLVVEVEVEVELEVELELEGLVKTGKGKFSFMPGCFRCVESAAKPSPLHCGLRCAQVGVVQVTGQASVRVTCCVSPEGFPQTESFRRWVKGEPQP